MSEQAVRRGLVKWSLPALAGLLALALAAPPEALAAPNRGEYHPHGWRQPNIDGALKTDDQMVNLDPAEAGDETRREEFTLPDDAGRVLRLSHNGRVFCYVVDQDLADPWDYQIVDYDGSGGFEMKEAAFADLPPPRWTFINHPFLNLRTADYTVRDPGLKELIDSLAVPGARPCRKKFTPEQRAALAVARGGPPPPDECLPEPESAVPAEAPGATPPAESAGEAPRVALNIQFEFGSDELTSQARFTLDILGQAMTSPELADNIFRLEGHTDAAGSPSYNLDLSLRRALAVRDYLMENFRLFPGQLRPQGFGAAVPLPGLEPEDGRNRRVEVVNLSAGRSLTMPVADYRNLPPEPGRPN
ncbi:MAG: OmpA family protein [Candidatus Adiutrix sp.]|jgi:outer membrane protein OmpA-like peptidoglycan-associated protein|nr:OmpA family protein [Candidatus Adiutrix sp.]